MNLIVNVGPDWGIGRDGALLTPISADLKRFRQLTSGKTVILGRKTLATFPGGRPLKNRRNLILSRDPSFQVEGAEVVHSVEELFQAVAETPDEELWVIGGAAVYELLLPWCTAAEVTKNDAPDKADTFFPDLDRLPGWTLVETGPELVENGVSFRYLRYENTAPEERSESGCG